MPSRKGAYAELKYNMHISAAKLFTTDYSDLTNLLSATERLLSHSLGDGRKRDLQIFREYVVIITSKFEKTMAERLDRIRRSGEGEEDWKDETRKLMQDRDGNRELSLVNLQQWLKDRKAEASFFEQRIKDLEMSDIGVKACFDSESFEKEAAITPSVPQLRVKMATIARTSLIDTLTSRLSSIDNVAATPRRGNHFLQRKTSVGCPSPKSNALYLPDIHRPLLAQVESLARANKNASPGVRVLLTEAPLPEDGTTAESRIFLADESGYEREFEVPSKPLDVKVKLDDKSVDVVWKPPAAQAAAGDKRKEAITKYIVKATSAADDLHHVMEHTITETCDGDGGDDDDGYKCRLKGLKTYGRKYEIVVMGQTNCHNVLTPASSVSAESIVTTDDVVIMEAVNETEQSKTQYQAIIMCMFMCVCVFVCVCDVCRAFHCVPIRK